MRNDDGAAWPSFYGEDFFCYWRVKGVFDARKSACGLGSCLTQGSAVFFAEGRQKNRLAAVGASWARMEHWLRARDWGAIAGHAGRRLIPLVRGLEKRRPMLGLVHPKPNAGGLWGPNHVPCRSFFDSGATGLRMHDVGVEQLHGLDAD